MQGAAAVSCNILLFYCVRLIATILVLGFAVWNYAILLCQADSQYSAIFIVSG